MPEGEDPIIVKPGKYPGNPPIEGICVVIDDGQSWRMEFGEAEGDKRKITVDKERIYVSMPSKGNFIVVDDFTPPFPDDPDVVEDPPVKRKKKIAILRVNGDFTGVSNNGVAVPSEAKSEITIFYSAPE